MIKIKVSELKKSSANKPTGYFEDVISGGNVVDGVLFLEPTVYKELRKKYAPPPREWPLLLRPMKLLAKPEDTGLGDIVERTIGPVGGDAYKIWYRATFGKPCGCTKRKDNLNLRYPL